MKCALCKKEVYLPYRCSYCGQYFCDDHRLPEQHLCPDPPDARANKRTKIRIKR
ncbi:AN1-type zinc finger domain-containing protein [Candidatus Bathyarchaeota archaeon]|nr:AN1-type zinc finger domain-containing protein [Candidatus Bathyarchaeota archaeon]